MFHRRCLSLLMRVPLQSSRATKMETFVTKVSNSEIVWCLKVVMNNLSFNSCKDLSKTFQLMFPDSTIARKLSLSPAKVAYTIILFRDLHHILLITFYSHYKNVRFLLLVLTKL